MLRAAHDPIQHCFLTEAIFETGIGTLVLARGATPHRLTLSSFLIDVFCLGIKDVMFESVESEFFAMYMDATDAGSPMVAVDPGYCRKLLRDLAAWSQSIGFAPHRDFAAVERIFGDVNADASDAAFQFGRDGKPVFPARTIALLSFAGVLRKCGSASATKVSDSKLRPESDFRAAKRRARDILACYRAAR